MLLFVAALGVALAIRKLLPSSDRVRPVVSQVWLAVVAALLQVGLGVPPLHALSGSGRLVVVLTSYVLVGAWLVLNTIRQAPTLRRSGILISLGWLTNAIAITANHGMPVSRWALSEIGVRHPTVASGNLYKHLLAGPHTSLRFLGDCIPVALPILRNVISIGDVLVMVGVVIAARHVAMSPSTNERQLRNERRDEITLQATSSP